MLLNPTIAIEYMQLYQRVKALEAERRAYGKSISIQDKRRLIIRIRAIRAEANAMYQEHPGLLPSFKRLRELGL